MFSDRTASAFMAVRTSFSALLIRLLPAARVRSFLSSSSQHSSSYATTSLPTSFVPVLYSPQRVMKYDHASPVPASATVGRFGFSFLHSRPAPGGLRHVQWRVHSAARPPLPLLRALPCSCNHRLGTLRSQAPFSCLVINKNRVPFVQPLY